VNSFGVMNFLGKVFSVHYQFSPSFYKLSLYNKGVQQWQQKPYSIKNYCWLESDAKLHFKRSAICKKFPNQNKKASK
jgi:hypothetical protein